MTGDTLQLRVHRITREARNINTYELVHPDGASLPAFAAGAHIDVRVPGGFLRQYSLCNDPGERHRYVIGVLNEPDGLGGSRSMHENVRAGDLIEISLPRNHFPLVESATRHLLLAGGIGVTPMMAMIARLQSVGAEYRMVYCTRSTEQTAFRQRLAPLVDSGRVIVHHDYGDPSRSLDLAAVLRQQPPDTHLYYCGPAGFMRAVAAGAADWPADHVHFEYFQPVGRPGVDDPADNGLDSFQLRIASTGDVLAVGPDQSIVDVLRDNGIDVDTSCESGTCGTCRTRYLQGTPAHNDYVLTDKEQREWVMICCARSKSPMLVLDL
jgi:vanillate O-demethylase ferredoxin subunit